MPRRRGVFAGAKRVRVGDGPMEMVPAFQATSFLGRVSGRRRGKGQAVGCGEARAAPTAPAGDPAREHTMGPTGCVSVKRESAVGFSLELTKRSPGHSEVIDALKNGMALVVQVVRWDKSLATIDSPEGRGLWSGGDSHWDHRVR